MIKFVKKSSQNKSDSNQFENDANRLPSRNPPIKDLDSHRKNIFTEAEDAKSIVAGINKSLMLRENSEHFAMAACQLVQGEQQYEQTSKRARSNLNKLRNVILAVIRFGKKPMQTKVCKTEEKDTEESSNQLEQIANVTSLTKQNCQRKTQLKNKRSISEEEMSKCSLDSIQRSVFLLEESEQFALATSRNFLAQGEQLHKVDEKLDQIEEKTRESRKNLNKLKNVFWAVILFGRISKKQDNCEVSKIETSKLENAIKKLSLSSTKSDISGAESNIQRSGSDAKSAGLQNSSIDEQIDENLDAINRQLNRLRDISFSMCNEIDEQNNLLDKITIKVDKADAEIRCQTNEIRKTV